MIDVTSRWVLLDVLDKMLEHNLMSEEMWKKDREKLKNKWG